MTNAIETQIKLRLDVSKQIDEVDSEVKSVKQRLRDLEVRRRELWHGLIGINAEIERLVAEEEERI